MEQTLQMRLHLTHQRVLQLTLGLFFLLLNLQMLSITGWMTLQDEFNQKSIDTIKGYHVASLLFLPFFLTKTGIWLPKLPRYVFHFCVWVVFSSVALYTVYGANSMIINYLFAFFCLLIGGLVASQLTQDQVMSVLRMVALLVFCIIAVKLLYYHSEIVKFLKAPIGHPNVETLFGGGVNLEATWVAFHLAFFIRSRKWLFYGLVAFSLGLSILYASRVGVILSLLVFLLRFISAVPGALERRNLLTGLVLLLLLALVSLDIGQISQKVYGLKRFADFGSSQDAGMSGRMAMWEQFPEAMAESHYLGYGAGNAMLGLEKVSGIDFSEQNVHNYYLQVLLEFGMIGLPLYLILVYQLLKRIHWSKLANPLAVILLCYFISSLIQFRGAESMIWLYMGIFFVQYRFKPSLSVFTSSPYQA
ncbi:O-antigen ligase family protein [Nibribacter koreensis]|uniref:O-antigen ligase-related domain-containing protein n=1 Tax=Nibribacter koreensis TaxID=1084519 RepID=A0ABP8FB28_9BACT